MPELRSNPQFIFSDTFAGSPILSVAVDAVPVAPVNTLTANSAVPQIVSFAEDLCAI